MNRDVDADIAMALRWVNYVLRDVESASLTLKDLATLLRSPLAPSTLPEHNWGAGYTWAAPFRDTQLRRESILKDVADAEIGSSRSFQSFYWFHPMATNGDSYLKGQTDGYFDLHDRPPWDCWIHCHLDALTNRASILCGSIAGSMDIMERVSAYDLDLYGAYDVADLVKSKIPPPQ